MLKEEVFVEQPQGFHMEGAGNKVYKLREALYGCKQAPRTWYEEIDKYFMKKGFERSKSEPTLYVLQKETSILIVSLYIDDSIVTRNDYQLIQSFK